MCCESVLALRWRELLLELLYERFVRSVDVLMPRDPGELRRRMREKIRRERQGQNVGLWWM